MTTVWDTTSQKHQIIIENDVTQHYTGLIFYISRERKWNFDLSSIVIWRFLNIFENIFEMSIAYESYDMMHMIWYML